MTPEWGTGFGRSAQYRSSSRTAYVTPGTAGISELALESRILATPSKTPQSNVSPYLTLT